jgi:hypothetical protein
MLDAELEPESHLTTSPVARELESSESYVRREADAGRLPSIRTVTGVRIFRKTDVIAFKARMHKRSA